MKVRVFRISYCGVDRKLKYWARKPESGKEIAATMVGYYYSESIFVVNRLHLIKEGWWLKASYMSTEFDWFCSQNLKKNQPKTVNFTSSRVLTPQLHLILHVVVVPKIFFLISSRLLHSWCTCLPVKRNHNKFLWCCLFLGSRISSYRVIGSYILGVRL